MASLCLYNFCGDKDTITPSVAKVNRLSDTAIFNAIYNHLRLSKNVTDTPSFHIPSAWDFDTILDANFNGNIAGGNISQKLQDMDFVRLKRRRVGSFDWMTVEQRPVDTIDDLKFVFYDNLAANNTDYEYALTTVTAGIESDYEIDVIRSEFNGVYLCDADTIYKFYAGVKFEQESLSNKTAVYEPLSSRYPIVISNGALKYFRGSFTGTVVSPQEMETRILDIERNIEYKRELLDFIVNKKAKVIKDWNGKLWLIMIVDNVTVSPYNNISGRLADVNFHMTEIGDGHNRDDLYNAGVLKYPQV